MIETGVNISLQDSASTTARTIANDFDKIAKDEDATRNSNRCRTAIGVAS